MTRDDIIRLAREAGWKPLGENPKTEFTFFLDNLERFAALVAAAERKSMDLNAIHTCHAECQNPFCVRVREAVAHEREQCAKLCENGPLPKESTTLTHIPTLVGCAAAIRARGNTGIKWEVEP
jgi:hypothetical protein